MKMKIFAGVSSNSSLQSPWGKTGQHIKSFISGPG